MPELHFQLTDEVIALRFDFILYSKQLPPELATLGIQFAQLFCEEIFSYKCAAAAAVQCS